MKTNFRKLIILPLLFLLFGCEKNRQSNHDIDYTFGVFIGMDKESKDLQKLCLYQNVAIDIEEFDDSDIKTLKEHNVNIFSYLSVGSLEDYRPYYSDFEKYTFMDYDNWEHERWIDVSQPAWQKHLIETAQSFQKQSADGLFLDNYDVYYIVKEEYKCDEYFKEGIYQGLKYLLNEFDNLGLSLMVNSGTTFLERLTSEKCGCINYIDWYAQETVFSSIVDYGNNIFGVQDEEERSYYLEMIDLMKNYSKILMIEYTTDVELINEIGMYAKRNNVSYFISESVNLE